MTLLASAADRRHAAIHRYGSKGGRACCRRAAQQSIDIACPRGPRQQTRRMLLQRSIDRTDRRTDARQLDRPRCALLWLCERCRWISSVVWCELSNPGLKRQVTTALRLHPGRTLQPNRRAFRICVHDHTTQRADLSRRWQPRRRRISISCEIRR